MELLLRRDMSPARSLMTSSMSRDLDAAGPPTAPPPLPARRKKWREPAAPSPGEPTAAFPVNAGRGTTHDDEDVLSYKVDVCGDGPSILDYVLEVRIPTCIPWDPLGNGNEKLVDSGMKVAIGNAKKSEYRCSRKFPIWSSTSSGIRVKRLYVSTKLHHHRTV